MKRYLLGTTALVAAGLVSGGVALAQDRKPQPIQLSVGGYFEGFVNYVSEDDGAGEPGANRRDHGFSREAEIRFRGNTVLDNGLQVGVDVQLEAETCGDQIDESFVWFESQFGRVEFGSTDSAPNKMWYGSPTPINGHGLNSPNHMPVQQPAANLAISPTTFVLFGTGDSEKLTYFTPRIAGFQFGASYTPDSCEEANPGNAGAISCGGSFGGMEPDNSPVGQQSEILELGANFVGNFGGVDVAVYGGYGKGETEGNNAAFDDNRQWGIGGNIGFMGFIVGAAYLDNDNAFGIDGYDREELNVGVAYATGPWTFAVQYHHTEAELAAQEDELDGLAVGAIFALGPGINLTGGVQYFDFQSNSGLPADENEAIHVVFGTRIDF